MAVLKQEHEAFDNFTVLDTVIMGHKEMYDIMVEKDAIYMDPEATDADGLKAAELENTFWRDGRLDCPKRLGRAIEQYGDH